MTLSRTRLVLGLAAYTTVYVLGLAAFAGAEALILDLMFD